MKKANKRQNKGQSVGIIGVGVVGGAIQRYFEFIGKKPFIYDKYKKLGSTEEVNRADIIFVCMATPYKGKKGFDLSMVEDAFRIIKGKKTIILKSTVWPMTTEKLQKKYSQHRILFNPEFLSEATADNNFRNPDTQLIGYTNKSRTLARDILKILPRAPFEKIMPARDAEIFKYFHNIHGAVKVIFANQMYDICEKIGVNFDNMVECAAASRNIATAQYLNVWHKGFRGYGGSCFPKDMKALIQFGEKLKVDLKMFKMVEKINKELSKKSLVKDTVKKSW